MFSNADVGVVVVVGADADVYEFSRVAVEWKTGSRVTTATSDRTRQRRRPRTPTKHSLSAELHSRAAVSRTDVVIFLWLDHSGQLVKQTDNKKRALDSP